jgi:hypothetical protein
MKSRIIDRTLKALYVAMILYLCCTAIWPRVLTAAPKPLAWFGQPGSEWTILAVLVVPLLFVVHWRFNRNAPSKIPLLLLTTMATSALLLGMSSYWRCHGSLSPFFTPLVWTIGLFVGEAQDPFAPGSANACAGESFPVALELARLLAIAAVSTTVLAAVSSLFRQQVDRLAIRFAKSITVAVGVQDDTTSIIKAVASKMHSRETLVVLTDDPDSIASRQLRSSGARVEAINTNDLRALARLHLWRRLDRLYLLSPDQNQNRSWLEVIDGVIARHPRDHVRLPLTFRLDNPSSARVWRRQALGNTGRRWAADAIGLYEIAAARVGRHIAERGGGRSMTALVCGKSSLADALVAEFAQVARERQVHTKPGSASVNEVVVMARGAAGLTADYTLQQARMAPEGVVLPVIAVDAEADAAAVCSYLEGRNPADVVVIFTEPDDANAARLSNRIPGLVIYQASAVSQRMTTLPIVANLYNFPVSIVIDDVEPQDVWERAAALIHERYRMGSDRDSGSNRPWSALDPFYQQSNRRQLLNALWMVEEIGQQTWNTLQDEDIQPLQQAVLEGEPRQQLAAMGFTDAAIEKMLRAEHNDWCRYYRAAGWKYGKTRDEANKRHDQLLEWDQLTASYPDFPAESTRSLASTLITLRALGYRCKPKASVSGAEQANSDTAWQYFRRRGVVTAERRSNRWTWRTDSGDEMVAEPGDWAVKDDLGKIRSVSASVFDSTHEEIGPNQYRRTGRVKARPARPGEVIKTVEGGSVAAPGSWIVEGAGGEQWPVPAGRFESTYDGPLEELDPFGM